jgi:hypothetical protein
LNNAILLAEVFMKAVGKIIAGCGLVYILFALDAVTIPNPHWMKEATMFVACFSPVAWILWKIKPVF